MSRARFGPSLAAGLILATAGPASAYPPNGDLDVILGGSRSVRPHAAGDADSFCMRFAAEFDRVDFCDADLFVDAKGRISGSVAFTGSDDGLLYSLAGPIKGGQRGDDRSGITSVAYAVKLSGEASDGSASLGVKGSVELDLEIDPAGVVTGTWYESLCVQGAACDTRLDPVKDWPLTSGRWWLALSTWDSGGGTIEGTATLRFERDPTSCSYTCRGRYDRKSDAANLKLTATSPQCAATTLQLKGLHLDREITGQIRYAFFGLRGETSLESASARFDYRSPIGYSGASMTWFLFLVVNDANHFPEF